MHEQLNTPLLCNIVLVSAVQQSASAICIHLSPPSRASLPHPPPFHPSRLSQNTRLGSLLYCSFPLVICFMHGNPYMSMLFSHFAPTSPSPLCPPDHCLHLHLLFFSVSRFIATIFFIFLIYVLIHKIYFYFSDFTLYNSLLGHSPHYNWTKFISFKWS